MASDTRNARGERGHRPGGLNAHIYPSAMRHESRMLKITETLRTADLFDRICLIGVEDGGERLERLDDRREIWRVGGPKPSGAGTLGKIRYVLGWSRAVWRALAGQRVACVNAHSLAVLPLAVCLKLRHRARLVYDTHELETETVTMRGARQRLAKVVERLLMRFVDEISVVCDPIGEWYRSAYGRDRVWVVKNVPPRTAFPDTRSVRLREAHGVGESDMLFIYQGVIGPGRPIPQLLAAFANVRPDQHIVFMGYGSQVPMVEDAARRQRNVHYQPAVPPGEIAQYTSGADVGFSVAENLCLSYYLSLPNKLFEYVNAGVPILVSDFPGFTAVVTRDDCGWVVPDLDSGLSGQLAHLEMDEVRAKRANVRRAYDRYDWRHEQEVLLRMYRTAFGEPLDGPVTTG